ncbi:phage tail protein [Shewanella surugensis]|uniref:Phage tail protein n=1 Tax=Shewanella surugensis TaxID=212020 RepID=A0ABT0L766_9GAMM|nr:phage tail protein [Shewanella surugensis]MCL1123532.1 phage tail protein [Shewanella surugensis]
MSQPQIQEKTQLQQLSEFLLASLSPIVKKGDLDAWQEGGTVMRHGDDLGHGYRVAKWKYKASIAIERFPHTKINPYNLLGLIAAYFIDNAQERDDYQLGDPELTIDPISQDNTTIIIDVELMDNIDLLPDSNGPILFDGQRYRVSLVPVNVATDMSLFVHVKDELDV